MHMGERDHGYKAICDANKIALKFPIKISSLKNFLFSNFISLHSQDILQNKEVKLDHMFIASLVSDIVRVRD